MLPETVGDAAAGTIIAIAPMPASMPARTANEVMGFSFQFEAGVNKPTVLPWRSSIRSHVCQESAAANDYLTVGVDHLNATSSGTLCCRRATARPSPIARRSRTKAVSAEFERKPTGGPTCTKVAHHVNKENNCRAYLAIAARAAAIF